MTISLFLRSAVTQNGLFPHGSRFCCVSKWRRWLNNARQWTASASLRCCREWNNQITRETRSKLLLLFSNHHTIPPCGNSVFALWRHLGIFLQFYLLGTQQAHTHSERGRVAHTRERSSSSSFIRSLNDWLSESRAESVNIYQPNIFSCVAFFFFLIAFTALISIFVHHWDGVSIRRLFCSYVCLAVDCVYTTHRHY